MMLEGRLVQAEIRKNLKAVSGWKLEKGEITKDYKFKDFKKALAFVNKVGRLAEKADHHPDIDIRYNKVRLVLSTHPAGGLTPKGFALAPQFG